MRRSEAGPLTNALIDRAERLPNHPGFIMAPIGIAVVALIFLIGRARL